MELFEDDWYADQHSGQESPRAEWHKEWLKEMYTGEGYMNLEVMIAFKHQRKGRFGTVIGYDMPQSPPGTCDFVEYRTDSDGNTMRTVRPYEGDMQVTLQLEMTAEKITLPIDRVVERR